MWRNPRKTPAAVGAKLRDEAASNTVEASSFPWVALPGDPRFNWVRLYGSPGTVQSFPRGSWIACKQDFLINIHILISITVKIRIQQHAITNINSVLQVAWESYGRSKNVL